MTMNDRECLTTFAKTSDETAFRLLTEKYAGLVYGCALRKTGDRALAEEVTQNVFTALARKAPALKHSTSLAAWLHRAAVLESLAIARAERRHRQRVKALSSQPAEVMEQNTDSPDAVVERAEVESHLDDALLQLRDSDRQAVLMRFFRELSYREIALELNTSEDASRKRVDRSLKRLGGLLGKQGVKVSATTLTGMLGASLALTPPPSLAASVAHSATAAASSLSFLAKTLTFVKTMAHLKSSALILGGIACLLCGTGGYVAGTIERDKRAAKVAVLYSLKGKDSPSLERASTVANPGIANANTNILDLNTLLASAAASFREDTPEGYRHGMGTLTKLKPQDIVEAIAYVESVTSEKSVWEGMLSGVLARWVASEPEAALDYANRVLLGEKIASRVFSELGFLWAKRDPDAAFNWFRENEIPSDVSQAGVRQRLYEGWLHLDSNAALASAQELHRKEGRDAVEAVSKLVGNDVKRSDILLSIGNLPDSEFRTYLIGQSTKAWAEYAPAESAKWFDSLSIEDANDAVQAAIMLTESWIEKDPHAAMSWIWPKVATSEGEASIELREELLEFAGEKWMESDPGAAEAWLQQALKNVE